MTNHHFIKYLNLTLLVVFPIAWFSPLLTTSVIPQWQLPAWLGGTTLFEPEPFTAISSIQVLWTTDIWLALLVTLFALIAPMVKCLGMTLIHFNLLRTSAQPIFRIMGKLAMADIFILALYIVIAKDIGLADVSAAWGLYLFTAAVLTSLAISLVELSSIRGRHAQTLPRLSN